MSVDEKNFIFFRFKFLMFVLSFIMICLGVYSYNLNKIDKTGKIVLSNKKAMMEIVDRTASIDVIEKAKSVYFLIDGVNIEAKLSDDVEFIDSSSIDSGVKYNIVYNKDDYSNAVVIRVTY